MTSLQFALSTLVLLGAGLSAEAAAGKHNNEGCKGKGPIRITLQNHGGGLAYMTTVKLGGQELNALPDTGSDQFVANSVRTLNGMSFTCEFGYLKNQVKGTDEATPCYNPWKSGAYKRLRFFPTMINYGSGSTFSQEGQDTLSFADDKCEASEVPFMELLSTTVVQVLTHQLDVIMGISPMMWKKETQLLTSQFGVNAFSFCFQSDTARNGFMYLNDPRAPGFKFHHIPAGGDGMYWEMAASDFAIGGHVRYTGGDEVQYGAKYGGNAQYGAKYGGGHAQYGSKYSGLAQYGTKYGSEHHHHGEKEEHILAGCHDKACRCIADTGTSLIVLPKDVTENLEAALQRIDAENDFDCNDETLHRFPTISFKLAGQEHYFQPEDYMAYMDVDVEEAPAKKSPMAAARLPEKKSSTLTGFWPKWLGNNKAKSASFAKANSTAQANTMAKAGPMAPPPTKTEKRCVTMFGEPLENMCILGMPFFRNYYTTFNMDKKTISTAPHNGHCNPARGFRQKVDKPRLQRIDPSNVQLSKAYTSRLSQKVNVIEKNTAPRLSLRAKAGQLSDATAQESLFEALHGS